MEAILEEVQVEKYAAYKDSGVEWLGEIPEHWKVVPGFTVVEERNEKNIGLKEKTVLSLSYGRVIVKPEEKLTGLVPESFETYQLVYPGDIIIRPTDLQNDKNSLRTGLAKDKGIITSAYINLGVKPNLSTSFYHYFLHCVDITKVIYGLGSGLRQNLDFRDFKRFKFLLPPKEEQLEIVKFLDQKTTAINNAIDLKKKQIKLLKERRQIIITNAVTRGLNPDALLKESKVEWIGEIPAHWEILNLRKLVGTNRLEFQDGNHGGDYPKETEFVEKGIPFIKPRDIKQEYVDWENSDKLPLERCLKFRIGFAKNDDVLLVNRGGTIGKVCFVSDYQTETDFFIINPQMTYLRAKNNLLPKFLYAITQSQIFQVAVELILGHGSTFPFLGLANMGDFKITIPPLIEQKEIVHFIENSSTKIINSISIKEKEIEMLKEYKATLINSAVTGKIKVC